MSSVGSPWADIAQQLLTGVTDNLTDDQLRLIGKRIEREVDVFFVAIAVAAVAGLAVGAFGGLALGVVLGNLRPR